MATLIGQTALNIAIVLYLIHYLPQLVHNMHAEKLRAVNVHFHGLLSISYLADLSYGFGLQLPWQYRLVSLTGTICLLIQHRQLQNIHAQAPVFRRYGLLLVAGLFLFCVSWVRPLSHPYYVLMGYLAQAGALLYLLPALHQNWRTKDVRGLSPNYLALNGLCYTCSLIAAFALDWPTPSKLGSSFGLCCLTILLVQYWQYAHRDAPVSTEWPGTVDHSPHLRAAACPQYPDDLA
ncbi:MAG: PQ-loop repeat-containing protein [Legionellaceae bacterium]|nr:PQ-loop repeat-containing protein [Legionellaceae bacterium]